MRGLTLGKPLPPVVDVRALLLIKPMVTEGAMEFDVFVPQLVEMDLELLVASWTCDRKDPDHRRSSLSGRLD
jgi:hypothetical protein